MMTGSDPPKSQDHAAVPRESTGAVIGSHDILRALRGMLMTAAIGSTCALVGGLAFDDRPAIVVGVLGLLGVPVVWRMVARGHAAAASLCLIGLFNALTIYAVVFGGGVQDPTAMLFPVMIIASGLLLDRRLATAASITIVASCIGVGVAELSGLIHTNLTHELSISDVAFQAVLIGAVASMVALLSRALRESVQRAVLTDQSYQEIFNASGEGIIVHDARSARVVEMNDAALALFGYDRESAADFDLDSLSGPEAPFHRQGFEERLRNVGPEPTSFEWCATKRDREPVWLDVTIRKAAVQGHERVVSVLRDTSERRELEEQVQQAEKLRAVGQLARGVAHDFNNQLTVILANASLLEAGVSSDPELAEYADAIIQGSRRSADLTQQLLAFARKGQQQSERVDINRLVAEVRVLLGRSIDKRIEIVHERSGDPAVAQADSTFLQNALLNLGLNARDAMPDGGTLRFRVDGPGAKGHDPIRIFVEDTGCGMTKAVQDHIFEPFYTTKTDGNGMGLAAVYGTVAAHGGCIHVESQPGRGTRFTLELPATTEASDPKEPRRETSEATRFEGVRVLMAEDEGSVARVAKRILEHLGCEVTHCEDGEAALALLADEGDFDVALLDHSMPRMTGAETLEALRDRGNRIPVISMSGYAETDDSPRYQPDAFVPKPFTLQALSDAFEAVLKRGQS